MRFFNRVVNRLLNHLSDSTIEAAYKIFGREWNRRPIRLQRLVRRFYRILRNASKFAHPVNKSSEECTHLKGHGPISGYRDYNVSVFTFADSRTRIRCNQCTFVSWRGDKNWKEAVAMARESTNTAASSERVIAQYPQG